MIFHLNFIKNFSSKYQFMYSLIVNLYAPPLQLQAFLIVIHTVGLRTIFKNFSKNFIIFFHQLWINRSRRFTLIIIHRLLKRIVRDWIYHSFICHKKVIITFFLGKIIILVRDMSMFFRWWNPLKIYHKWCLQTKISRQLSYSSNLFYHII